MVPSEDEKEDDIKADSWSTCTEDENIDGVMGQMPEQRPVQVPWARGRAFVFLFLVCLTLCLATQAMSAIFTDSSHQPIWFSLPQTVTFIETSLQMRGLQSAGRPSPRGHSPAPGIGLDRTFFPESGGGIHSPGKEWKFFF
uniref:Uncharacterized protein n=1 Tax=Molossus molossus TaxID=27622 RepID=A0A7J8EE51_MOLMO|nr:hypothetical protein HJG59_008841 [Molossus molossus]